jgi:phosphate-selective porin OprO and OprP
MKQHIRVALFLTMSISTLSASAQTPPEKYFIHVGKTMEMRGLVETRYQLFDDTSKNDGFDLRRARLDMKGDVAQNVTMRIHIELAGSPKILDGTFTYHFNDLLNINAGQSKIPVSYDNIVYGPWNLLTVSRPQLDNTMSIREGDLYGNQNGRDIGIWITGKYGIKSGDTKRPFLDYSLGVYNGAGINVGDNNSKKDICAALGFAPINRLWIYGRVLNGYGQTTADPNEITKRSRVGGSANYKINNWSIEAEYLAALDENDSIGTLNRSAYYATIAYKLPNEKFQFISRLDNYDPSVTISGNTINKCVFAGSYFFGSHARIMAEYDLVLENWGQQTKNNLFAIQFQASF